MLKLLRQIGSVLLMHAPGIWIALVTGYWWAALIPIPLFGMAGPSVLTDDYGLLLTTTLRAMQPKIRDNISRGSKFLKYLEMRGRWRKQDGGERVKIGLMYGLNSTADIYSGYGNLDTTPQDGVTSAFYTWSQIAVAIAISRLEERQNSGQSAALSMLETKTNQAMASARELLNNCATAGRITASASTGQFFARVGRLDSGASGPLPLAALIDASPSRSVAIGNINGNTFSFWRNQQTTSSATTFAGLKQEMNTTYNNCSKGVGGFPDLLLSDQVAWEEYFNALANQERYLVTDKRVIDVLGGPNGSQDDLIRFRGATFTWDEVVPDVNTNAEVVDGIGTVGFSTIFYINSEAFEWVVDSETDFMTTPFVRPVGQDARVAEILWMGAIGVNNRRKNGVHHHISRSIVS